MVEIKEAQKFVKDFALKQNWEDGPCVDKFDHLHEELVEMSRLLRYKNKEERISVINQEKEKFKDGVGDLFFALCRLSNQLDIDLVEAFEHVKNRLTQKFDGLEESKSDQREEL